ncbi:MFS family permease [Streptomyces sp. TE3672]
MGRTVSEAVQGAAGRDAGAVGGERRWVVGVAPWGVAAGAVAWCLAGSWRAAHTQNYAWNTWTPVGYGAVKGVFLGLLAGWCAVVVLRIVPADRWRAGGGAVARFAGLVFAGGLLGGLVPGTLRDFLGEPQPRTLYYFDGPRPESQWFWRPLLAEWLTYTVLPAFGCAVLLTVGAVVSARCSRRDRFGWAVPALVGVGLLFLPGWAAAGLPEPQGNGDHVNESAGAGLVVLATGLGLLLSAWAVRSWRGARRPVGPRAPVLTPARSSPTPPRSARGGG